MPTPTHLLTKLLRLSHVESSSFSFGNIFFGSGHDDVSGPPNEENGQQAERLGCLRVWRLLFDQLVSSSVLWHTFNFVSFLAGIYLSQPTLSIKSNLCLDSKI